MIKFHGQDKIEEEHHEHLITVFKDGESFYYYYHEGFIAGLQGNSLENPYTPLAGTNPNADAWSQGYKEAQATQGRGEARGETIAGS